MRLDPTKASTRKTIFGIWLIWWNSLEKGRNSWWWWEWSFSYTESGGEKPKEDSMSTWVWKRHLCPLWDFVIFKKNHNYRNRIDRNSLFPWKASPSDIAIALIGPFSFLCGFKCYKNSRVQGYCANLQLHRAPFRVRAGKPGLRESGPNDRGSSNGHIPSN